MNALIKEIWANKYMIWQLAKNDCKARYAASALGTVWAILHPLSNILVLWLVFQVGFQREPVEGVPFIAWYIPAYLVWNYFIEGISQTTNSVVEYSYLLKKVNFKSIVIPLIKVLSASIVHMFFMIVIVIISLIYSQYSLLYLLQLFYYFFCTACFIFVLGIVLAPVVVYIRDIANLVGVAIQVGFWITPLFWNPTDMSPRIRTILKLNPMYYICMGYRDSAVYGTPFWHYPLQTIGFWAMILILLLIGCRVFNHLSKYFDDVL